MLNKVKGNMFGFITHTWNPIAGICPHKCTYCYMKKMRRFPVHNVPLHYKSNYMKDNLGKNNFIFIGSSTDIFANEVKNDWLLNVFCKAISYNNTYLLQTKNPLRYLLHLDDLIPQKFILSTTIETDRYYTDMGKTPPAKSRALAMKNLPKEYRRMVTIEPIMKFNLKTLVKLVLSFKPEQINIGADSGCNDLYAPTIGETIKLIETLKKETTVYIKPNLEKIIGGCYV